MVGPQVIGVVWHIILLTRKSKIYIEAVWYCYMQKMTYCSIFRFSLVVQVIPSVKNYATHIAKPKYND